MVSFQELFGNFLWLGLFILAGFTFIIFVQDANNAAQPILENPLFNESFEDLTSTLSGLEDTSGIQYSQFIGEEPKVGFGSIVLFGIVSAGKTFGNVIIGMFTILIKLPLVVIGIPQTLFSVIITWIIISLIIGAWVLYKLGG